jgi:hypothetical protein
MDTFFKRILQLWPHSRSRQLDRTIRSVQLLYEGAERLFLRFPLRFFVIDFDLYGPAL